MDNQLKQIDQSIAHGNSHRFEHYVNPLETNDEEAGYTFEYGCDRQTDEFASYCDLKTYVAEWSKDLNLLGLNLTNTANIFQMTMNLIEKLSSTNIEICQRNQESFDTILKNTEKTVLNELKSFQNRYKYKKTISSGASYVHPIEKVIGTRFEMRSDKVSQHSIPRLIASTCQFVPITEQLQQKFEVEEFRKLYLEYNSQKHVCVDGEYISFCCGDVYKKSELFCTDPYAIQLQIYTDDFEICSPLQSKAGIHKLCAVYFAIKNFPIQFQSKLENIGLVCLCYSDDINKSTQADYNNIWRLLVEDLKKLETDGIRVGNKQIRGTICWPSFDNLGANTSLGFAGSFSSTYYCRFCECDSNECTVSSSEIQNKIRTKENYSLRVAKVESLEKVDYRKTIGVKRYCCLNDLKYFHITQNISVDILHDFYEGAMPFLLDLLFNFMIAQKIIKKVDIIRAIKSYSYGQLNRKNIPSIISFRKSNFGQNGSQSKCLFTHIPFIFAKYRENTKLKSIWNSFELLSRIAQIVHSTKISSQHLRELDESISEFLESIKSNFKTKLIPKLHNLTHYPRVIRSMGPVIYMSTIRFESKHKDFKQILSKSFNFTNVCKTLAIRHQELACISGNDFELKLIWGKKKLLTHPDSTDEVLLDIIEENDLVFETKYLTIGGRTFRPNFFFIYDAKLFKIERILEIRNVFYLYCSQYKVDEFFSFLNAYKISPLSPEHKELVEFENLSISNLCEKKIISAEMFLIAETLEIRLLVSV